MGLESWFYEQISYGRFTIKRGKNCEIDLFIVQSDGRKILDSSKQDALVSRLRAELQQPLRVVMMNRGPDTELLVTNPVELSGKGRPQVFYDIALALKKINTCIFSVYNHYLIPTTDLINHLISMNKCVLIG